jgi:hypothetical protein
MKWVILTKIPWFYYDKSTKKLLIMAQNVKKVQNIWMKLNVYFVSTTIRTFHTKDIKRQRFGNYSEDPKRILTIVEKINLKYLGTRDHLLAKMFIENALNGTCPAGN